MGILTILNMLRIHATNVLIIVKIINMSQDTLLILITYLFFNFTSA